MINPNKHQGEDREKQPLRVFIVDDSTVVRERLAAMLSELDGIEIAGQAAEAFSAYEGIRNLTPDVVILDIRMPGSSGGLYVLERLRRGGKAPVIIMLTNYSGPQYRKKCAEAGANFFFDKSTEFEKVPQVLIELLSALASQRRSDNRKQSM
jgi:DNA-binding NarL/FixJ family response regulator